MHSFSMKDNNSHNKSDKRSTNVLSYSYQMKRTIGDNMNRTKSIIIIAISLVIVSTAAMIVVYPYLQEDDEKEYLSANDLWHSYTMDNDGTQDFKGYSVGDIIKLKGRIEEVEEIEYMLPIYNDSAPIKFEITNVSKSYIKVWMDGTGFAFNHSVRDKLEVGRVIIFDVKIVYCEHIFYTDFVRYNGEFVDLQIPLYLHETSKYVENLAKRKIEINPKINTADEKTTIIDISEIISYAFPAVPDEYSEYCPFRYIRIDLYENDIRKDQIIFDYPQLEYQTGKTNIVESEKGIFYANIIGPYHISQNDNITVFNLNKNGYTYRLDFVWLITYPEEGYDTERVIGSVSWEI